MNLSSGRQPQNHLRIIHIKDKSNPSPAWVNRGRGVLFLNDYHLSKLTPLQRRFVILHELGHYDLGTSSEIRADKYALENIAFSAPYSLKSSWRALYRFVRDDKKRLWHLGYELAKKDFFNGNIKALNIIKQLAMERPALYNYRLTDLDPDLSVEEIIPAAWADFLQAQGYSQSEFDALPDSLQAEIFNNFLSTPLLVDLVQAYGSLSLPEEEHFLGAAGLALGNAVSWVAGHLGSVSGAVSKLLGKGGHKTSTSNSQVKSLQQQLQAAKSQISTLEQQRAQQAKRAQTMTYVAGGLGVLVILLAILYFSNRW